ncbi:hypothetical protein [Streptomyces chartreusis]
MPELVLWDIDHTLMATRGLGGELWDETARLHDVVSTTGHRLPPVGGT